tara:strand:+ start:1553 stop:1867 length:315 start_codon:yes stop_codon:yes gene_type:complete
MHVASHRGDFRCPTHGESVKLSPPQVLERRPLKTFPSTGARPQPAAKRSPNLSPSPTLPNSESKADKEAVAAVNVVKVVVDKVVADKETVDKAVKTNRAPSPRL